MTRTIPHRGTGSRTYDKSKARFDAAYYELTTGMDGAPLTDPADRVPIDTNRGPWVECSEGQAKRAVRKAIQEARREWESRKVGGPPTLRMEDAA